MVSRIISVEPFDLVVFGGTGDLAHRKLFPALFQRDSDGQFSEPTRVISVARREMSDAQFRENVAASLRQFVGKEAAASPVLERFLERIQHISVDVTGEKGWRELGKKLSGGEDRVRAFYLATTPELFGPIAEQLAKHDLVTTKARIIVEKPIGHDGASAAKINDAIGVVFKEPQIFRIDHYLGKETVQNLMALRFANALFEPVWNSAHIDHVQITVAETIGLEKRADYYESAGALRDMVQNHMLQLLCLVAMEPPAAFAADALRDEKLKVLKALVPVTEVNASMLTVRGQYRAGA
ncbi:MAG: glucose-6-phosphate dehydrogenase (NADP(+)), partial [Hyphomicrobiales bacterium]|nr:glucose-6-phosphate dehydrogenase (NADP(+)) [Hyphomicrobiales bacterium]